MPPHSDDPYTDFMSNPPNKICFARRHASRIFVGCYLRPGNLGNIHVFYSVFYSWWIQNHIPPNTNQHVPYRIRESNQGELALIIQLCGDASPTGSFNDKCLAELQPLQTVACIEFISGTGKTLKNLYVSTIFEVYEKLID